MASKESQVAAQVRLSQWALEIQDCQNRPKEMTVDEWSAQHNITKANYYWRLKRVRQTLLEQMESAAGSFVELPVPVQGTGTTLSAPNQINTDSCTFAPAVLHTTGGISIEIRESATSDFIKKLIGAVANA